MKILWQLKLKWNEPLPDDVKQQWEEFQLTIFALNQVFVDRKAIIANPVKLELHGFCDASDSAYGSVIYIRAMDFIGNAQVSSVRNRVSHHRRRKHQLALNCVELSCYQNSSDD